MPGSPPSAPLTWHGGLSQTHMRVSLACPSRLCAISGPGQFLIHLCVLPAFPHLTRTHHLAQSLAQGFRKCLVKERRKRKREKTGPGYASNVSEKGRYYGLGSVSQLLLCLDTRLFSKNLWNDKLLRRCSWLLTLGEILGRGSGAGSFQEKKKSAENITAAISVQYVLNQKGEHVLGSPARTQMF